MQRDRELHVQTEEGKSTDPAKPTEPTSRLAEGIARGAVVVAGLTILSRILGLVRTLVFSQAVGASCLGTAYVTANQVPDLLYQLVLGGALASAMVPVLARSAERAVTDPAEKARVSQITSALLTWTVVITVPLILVIVAAAGPIASLLNPSNPNAHCVHADVVAATGDMLRVFAPQALLYGLSVVLSGLLQSYRRFAAPSIGPGISSLLLIACYLAFVPLNKGRPLAQLPVTAELVLSVGTTLGIAVLVVVALPPTWRLHLRLRPTLRFPPGVMRRAGGLAMIGLLEFVAGDACSVVIIDLANGHGDTGALVLNSYVTLVFTSMCSVLPGAIVTSVYPVMAAADGDELDRTSAGVTRAVVLMSWLSAAVILASSYYGYPLSTTQVVSGGVTGAGLGKRLASVHWDVVGQMVTAWIFTIPLAGLLGAGAWETSDLFSNNTAGSIVIALIAAAGALVLFRLAQRNKITPDELDRTHVAPDAEGAQLGGAAPAVT